MMGKRHYIGIGMLVTFVAAAFIGMNYEKVFSRDTLLERYVENVLEECASAAYRPSCYDTAIPKLMDKGVTLEETFAITQAIQQQDSSYWYCHVLGHNVSAKEAAKDPAQWASVVARCPQGTCSNGCLHGAFQERFRDEYVNEEELQILLPEIKSICTNESGGRTFTGLEQASCYHALGHLTMYVTNADINRATNVCDTVAVDGERDFRNLCYDGAYMQIFQPLEPEDIALVQDIAPTTKNAADTYCSQFTGLRKDSCMTESWPLFVEEFDSKQGAMEAFCGRGFTGNALTRCLNSVFYVMAARTNFDPARVRSLCSLVSEKNRAQCYANSASRFLEVDYSLAPQAVAVCEVAQASGFGDSCFEELLFYSTYNYEVGSEAFYELCAVFPSSWSERCREVQPGSAASPFYTQED